MVGEDWANCLLIAVQSPIELSHFTAVGKNLAVALCPEDTLEGVLLSHLPWVVSSRCCLIVEGGAALRSVPILYHGALLPLSEEGGAIDHVLGAANHRELIPEGAPITQATRKRWIRPRVPARKPFLGRLCAGAVPTLPEVIGLDQIALDGCGLVLGGGERDDDLERVFGRAAVEQHARSRMSS
jgi:hypothetical protein